MLLQDNFFRRFGARKVNHLLRPNVFQIDKFEFPKNSIWNYVDYDGVSLGPDTNDYFFREIQKKIFVEHVMELSSNIGTPRRLGVPLMPYVRQFHIQNKRFRLSMNIAEHPSDENTLGVVSYNLLSKAYRYPRSVYSEFNKWKNIEATIWQKMRTVAAASQRTQYYFMHLPKVLPSLQRLNMSCEKFNQTALAVFNNKDSLFLLEIWKWFSEKYRKDCIFAGWEQAEYDKVNLIVEDNGSWMMFNLGLLNQWRYVEGESPAAQRDRVDPIDVQKRFLRALMLLMSYRSEPELEVVEEDDEGNKIDAAIGIPSRTEEQAERNSTQEYEKMLKDLNTDLEQLNIIEQETTTLVRAEDSDSNAATDLTPKVAQDEEEQAKAVVVREKIQKTFVTAKDSIEPDTDVEVTKFETPVQVSDALLTKINTLADDGLIDGSEYRRKTKLLERYESLESPVAGIKLKDYIVIDPETLVIKNNDEQSQIPGSPLLPDQSMLKSRLLEFDSRYIKDVMNKDIVSMALATQKAGFIVTDYEVERNENITGSYDVHTMRVTPIEGQPSTLRFRLPSVQENGQFEIGTTKYFMQKQRADLPIRKISPTRVALSSYYGKTFVLRSERKSNNYAVWLHNQISAKSFEDNSPIKELHPSNVFDHEFIAPLGYTSAAQYLKSFKFKEFELIFDHKERVNVFSEEVREKYEVNGSVLFGISPTDTYLVMDKNSAVYEIVNGDFKEKGTLEEYLGIDDKNAPVEFAEARIFSKNIPVGVVLSYKLGLSNLIEMLNPEMRRVPVGQRVNLQSHEYGLVFSDETLVFSKEDRVAAMILAGFQAFEKTTKNYSVHTFDKTGVYLKLLEQVNLSVRYLREIDLLDEMFVDPITEEILKEMKEPVTYRGLLVRSCELLMTDYHKDPLDMQEMRVKGLERMAGAVYTELVVALREHKAKPNRRQHSIDLNPYDVWKRVTQDPAVMPANDLNPIQNLKEGEATTYGGTGGRNSRAMVKTTRAYHENDAGIISEATRDSSDVGINTFLVADPKFKSLRGITTKSELMDLPPSSLVSTSALLSVGGDQDSAQRLNMVSIQQSHSIACNGYKPSYVRTGYEHVVGYRAGESFSRNAKTDGKVVAVNDTGMIVEYSDGSKEGFEVGRRFGKSSDLTIPHQLETTLKVGDSFKKGDNLVYNKDFFEPERFNPKSVIWKNGLIARVALMESRQTHEDASSISRELAAKLTSRTTKIKDVVVTFDQHVRSALQIGTVVDNDTILCYIEDSITATNNLFDEDSLNTLKNLSRQSPTAKTQGIIEKIEVFYHGDIEDMTESLQALALASDKQLRQQARSQGKRAHTGQVDESFRIKGEPLQMDSLALRFYITGDNVSSIGDKGVFANQLKTIFSEVMDYEVRSESGLKIDAIFGAQSIFNRIVNSAFVIGTSNTLLDVIGKKAAKIYKGE